jgi:hypothetical protein
MNDTVADDVVDDTTNVVEMEPNSPEHDALADIRRQLAESEAARVAAEQRAAQAGGQVANAHNAALEAALSSEESRLNAAKAAYRAAREMGDIDAEVSASEEIAAARPRVDALKMEKQRMAAQRQAPQQPNAPQQQAGRIPGPAARAWMDDHPLINSDPAYANAAEAAHNRAIAGGHEPESPGYFASINRELESRFGENHGRTAAMTAPPRQQPGRQAPAQQQQQRTRPPASSFATPASRGNPTNARGGADINSIANALGVTADDVREAADFSNMPLDKYLKAQADILAERGSNQITYGNGTVYR